MRRYNALCLTALAAGLALTACGGEREAEGILEAASGCDLTPGEYVPG